MEIYMNRATGVSGVQEYKRVGLESEVNSATPHRLIQMLMEGILGKIAAAKLCIDSNNIAGKGESISTAISILNGLQASLDKEAGGDIAENLNNLYDYMSRRLLEANLQSDKSILDEVLGLLLEIKGAWDAIGPEVSGNQQVV
jgi:flagellar protein FliS